LVTRLRPPLIGSVKVAAWVGTDGVDDVAFGAGVAVACGADWGWLDGVQPAQIRLKNKTRKNIFLSAGTDFVLLAVTVLINYDFF
jgi:hypothetical protein